MNTLGWLVVWTGFAMWPTHLDVVFTYGGQSYDVRLVRDAVSDEWHGYHNGVLYSIVRPEGGTFQIEDDVSVVASLGDDFWLTAEHSAVFAGGLGVITVDSYRIDWTDLRVVFVPVFIGFLTGMLLDIVLLPAFLVMRITGVSSVGILPHHRRDML